MTVYLKPTWKAPPSSEETRDRIKAFSSATDPGTVTAKCRMKKQCPPSNTVCFVSHANPKDSILGVLDDQAEGRPAPLLAWPTLIHNRFGKDDRSKYTMPDRACASECRLHDFSVTTNMKNPRPQWSGVNAGWGRCLAGQLFYGFSSLMMDTLLVEEAQPLCLSSFSVFFSLSCRPSYQQADVWQVEHWDTHFTHYKWQMDMMNDLSVERAARL